MEFRTGRGACYASNIGLAHTFVIHLSRPWAIRRKGIGKKGLRAVLGLSLPSKGQGIKDKSCWLGLHSHCIQARRENFVSFTLCVESCFSFPFASLLLRLRSIHPFTTLTILFLLLSSPSPLWSRSSLSEDPRTMFVTPSQRHQWPALTRKWRGGELLRK